MKSLTILRILFEQKALKHLLQRKKTFWKSNICCIPHSSVAVSVFVSCSSCNVLDINLPKQQQLKN